ncbi:hypothetical protein B0H14DRAFT_2637464 [Mycena olivaceomarginata]|nr:hypothetical protein B0H14DRAFT_2637464 [Mycena olivaceomarginata]
MHTGKWWWSTQEAVEKDHPGATIIPIIISSDKTQLTVFGNKTAYPVYMSIGNIPKEIRRKPSRRSYVLLGYLPTSRMKNVKNSAARRRILANVFHACMSYILAPLKTTRVTGMLLTSGDGVTRRGHPIYATFVGDHPEQCLATAVKTGECPTCEVPRDELGEETKSPLRDLENILSALDALDEGPTIYAQACAEAGIKPIFHPFWEGLPYTNIFSSISSDVLHQLYQGIVKHLISWLKSCCGEEEIDARCRRLPPNHNIRLFMSGISNLSRVTGKEHDQISRFLLGIIVDIRLPDHLSPSRLLAAVRGILDFVYQAQYPMHTSETLAHLSNALQRFHDIKGIFVDLGLKMTKSTRKSVRITRLVADYGAKFFRDALTRFIVRLNHPTLSPAQVEAQSANIALPFNAVAVFHRIKYTTEDPYTTGGPTNSVVDAIHVQPGKQLKNGKELPGRFDTALVNDGTGKMTGVGGDLNAAFNSFKSG